LNHALDDGVVDGNRRVFVVKVRRTLSVTIICPGMIAELFDGGSLLDLRVNHAM
jgi:hypothetical protein